MTDIVPHIVELLDEEKRPYSEVWGATLHCAQQLIVDEVGYWLGLYRIKRDCLWQDANFDDQEGWIYELAHLPRFQGGCAESTFHEKMGIIEDLVDSGVSHEMIVHALTQPTATKMLLRHRDVLPQGTTVTSILESTQDDNPGQATSRVGEVLGLKKTWVSKLEYFSKEQKLFLSISEETGIEVDTRRYVIYEMPWEDAEFISRQLHRQISN